MATYICSKACIVDVHKSPAGYYIGAVDDEGPRCRISGYYKTQSEADMALLYGTYDRIADEISFCGPCFVEEEFNDPDDYEEPDWEEEYGFQFTPEKKLTIIVALQQLGVTEQDLVDAPVMLCTIIDALFGEDTTQQASKNRDGLVWAIIDHLHMNHCMTYNYNLGGWYLAPIIINFRK